MAGYLAHHPPRSTDTYRALARPDHGPAAIVRADQLEDDGWTAGPDVRQALPVYLREALAAGT
ncbi:hypothetical protein D0Z67_29515 (plasmid) [Streptomyces seoulensis]|uniref:Uncharacterized protein n=1 Tax=Streptomyces seoulensis TaxID=73044 RepID=A0A4P6U393_STRSO|nr:hypothetical protein D0Z67_29515 [Streptomyces seoulensis]